MRTGHHSLLLSRLAAVGVLFTACTSSYATRASQDDQMVRQQSARHAEAWLASDAQRLVELYDADGIIAFPDGPDVRGISSVRQMLTSLFSTTRIESLEVTRELVEVFGDVAYEWGTYREAYRPQGKPSIHEQGRYVMRWKRQPDGRWLISRFTGNAIQRSGG